MVRHRSTHDHGEPMAREAEDIHAAYSQGREDERARRKRHPFGMLLLALAAIVGVGLLALAALQGSFTDAGRVVDEGLSTAADRAEPAAREAASGTGEALRDARQNLTGDSTR